MLHHLAALPDPVATPAHPLEQRPLGPGALTGAVRHVIAAVQGRQHPFVEGRVGEPVVDVALRDDPPGHVGHRSGQPSCCSFGLLLIATPCVGGCSPIEYQPMLSSRSISTSSSQLTAAGRFVVDLRSGSRRLVERRTESDGSGCVWPKLAERRGRRRASASRYRCAAVNADRDQGLVVDLKSLGARITEMYETNGGPRPDGSGARAWADRLERRGSTVCPTSCHRPRSPSVKMTRRVNAPLRRPVRRARDRGAAARRPDRVDAAQATTAPPAPGGRLGIPDRRRAIGRTAHKGPRAHVRSPTTEGSPRPLLEQRARA